MSKITKCDICGREEVGRNPEGFSEIALYHKTVWMPDGYSDLCEECYEEYQEVYDKALRTQRETIMNWIMSKTNNLEGAEE
jgi:hypothetical protein